MEKSSILNARLVLGKIITRSASINDFMFLTG